MLSRESLLRNCYIEMTVSLIEMTSGMYPGEIIIPAIAGMDRSANWELLSDSVIKFVEYGAGITTSGTIAALLDKTRKVALHGAQF